MKAETLISPNLVSNYIMKTINVTFEDREYKKLVKKKGNLSWHDFIMKLCEEKDDGGNKSSNR